MSLHEALWFDRTEDGAVVCTLCPHRCRIRDGGRGACAVRYAAGGTLHTLVHDAVAARHVDPIEKKPLFHFLPGTGAYSVSTVGCNLQCRFCQNWDTSQWPRLWLPRSAAAASALVELERALPGERVDAGALVRAAQAAGCASIAYTYTEPTIAYELVLETATLARARGLSNVLVTNGYIEPAPLRRLAPLLDAVNVDLKAMDPATYRTVCRARLEPVLEAIRAYHDAGVWLEVTTLVIPGLNDSDHELRAIAAFVRSVGADVPWHVSAFFPAWRMTDRPPTPPSTLRRASEIGREAGLRWVYEGNVAGGRQDTRCPQCGALLVARPALGPVRTALREGSCRCGEPIAGVWSARAAVPRARA